jgi:hypothetical protein
VKENIFHSPVDIFVLDINMSSSINEFQEPPDDPTVRFRRTVAGRNVAHPAGNVPVRPPRHLRPRSTSVRRSVCLGVSRITPRRFTPADVPREGRHSHVTPNPKETIMFVPYYPDLVKVAEEMNVEILESYVPDSRLHQIINNPVTEGIDEG